MVAIFVDLGVGGLFIINLASDTYVVELCGPP